MSSCHPNCIDLNESVHSQAQDRPESVEPLQLSLSLCRDGANDDAGANSDDPDLMTPKLYSTATLELVGNTGIPKPRGPSWFSCWTLLMVIVERKSVQLEPSSKIQSNARWFLQDCGTVQSKKETCSSSYQLTCKYKVWFLFKSEGQTFTVNPSFHWHETCKCPPFQEEHVTRSNPSKMLGTFCNLELLTWIPQNDAL